MIVLSLFLFGFTMLFAVFLQSVMDKRINDAIEKHKEEEKESE